MPSSYSTLGRLELMADGENDNTWGAKTNANLTLLERMIAQRVAVVLAAADVTLTTANGADDEARCLALDCSGVLSANVNVIIPNLSHFYVVRNATTGGFTVTVKTTGGTGVVIPQGRVVMVWCDGVGTGTVYSTIDAAASAVNRNAWLAGNSDEFETVADAGTSIINCVLGNTFYWAIAGNRTAQIDGPVDGSWVELYIKQDATGGRTVTWPGNVLFVGGATPSLSTAPNAIDKIFMRYHLATTTWLAAADLNISAGGGGGSVDIVLDQNAQNVDIFGLAGRPAGATTITVRVNTGVVISSSSPATPAMDFAGFAASSNISIENNGVIHGHGGKGGRGGFAGDVTSADIFGPATAGTPGGDAIRLPALATTISITNANGRIWGGGGGGGGGGPSSNGSGSDVGSTGGGGGGGAGAGLPGDGGSVATAVGAPGVYGGVGFNGDFGAGGGGVSTGGGGGAATGGDGGTWGAAGAVGGSNTSGSLDSTPGTAGAAGKAVNVNGGTAPTFVSGSGSPNVKGAVA